MLTSTINLNVATVSSCVRDWVHQMIKVAIPSPRNAPSVSLARWIQRPGHAGPCRWNPRSAHRAALCGSLADAIRHTDAQHPSPGTGKIQQRFTECRKSIPDHRERLAFAERSESAPKTIFNRLAVVSATPSINPMTAVPTPRMFARKNGIILVNISEETSFSSDVRDITHTLRGKRRSEFSFSYHL